MDSDPPTTERDASESPASAESHKNEGFLKAAWHRLTHQHDGPPPEEPTRDSKAANKAQEEEPKKASGSGSG